MNTKRNIILAIAVAGGVLLAGCVGTQDASAPSTPTTITDTTAPTTRATTSPSVVDTTSPSVVDTTAADQATCSAFEDQIIGTGLQEGLDKIARDPNASFDAAIRMSHFVRIPIAGSGSMVNSAIGAFNTAVGQFNDASLSREGQYRKPMIDSYRVAVTACQGLIVPKPAVYSVYCGSQTFATYQEAWSINSTSYCQGVHVSGTQYSEQQRNAVTTAFGNADDMTHLNGLYGQCAAINANLAAPSVKLSSAAIKSYQGILILCPDHPQAATIQARIDSANAAVVASSAQSQAVTDGRYALAGSHLVGTEIQPGTWQSVGDRVTDCYWEISDSQGEIIDNNFISIAPQFTITIPSDAAGFTNRGCTFEWIGE